MKMLITLLLLCSIQVFAAPTAKVVKLRGTVTFQGKKLSKGQEISKSGKLITKKRSMVQIEVPTWNSTITLGPRAEMDFNFEETPTNRPYDNPLSKPYVFLKGLCRWATKALSGTKKGKVFTKNASFGVRGTDFLLVSNPLLGETEIVVFEGEVQFTNDQNNIDNKVVKVNQWGGLGGRFGNSIGEILTLPQNVIKVFKKRVPIK